MRILYVSQYYPPEMGAPAARVSELSRYWAQRGHEVTVLTGFPNHPTGVIAPEYRDKFRSLVCKEELEGVKVVRSWLIPLPNGKPLERILNYTSFCLSAAAIGSFLQDPDVIIATTPQLLVGVTGLWLSRLKAVPFVLEVRDIWPDAITASGVGGVGSILTSSLQAASLFVFRTANHIVVVTSAFKEELVGKWTVPGEKISVIENGVDTSLFTPASDAEGSPDGDSSEFVVSYIGTFGLAQGLGLVMDVAARMQKSHPKVVFQLVGEGADKEYVIALAFEKGLRNVRVLPQQPREKIPAMVRGSQVCLVLLKKADIFKTVIPTKMLEFMACGRPVIVGVDGLARKVIEQADAGLYVEPENSHALEEAIIKLYENPGLRHECGINGRKHIVERLSREGTADAYLEVLERVAAVGGRPSAVIQP